jgi:hypothetical protein
VKAFLMYPDRDFDTERELPANEPDLSSDLELDILLRAMAAGDKFLFEVARHAIHSGLSPPLTSRTGSRSWRTPSPSPV